MIIRQALPADIPQMHKVRVAVRENILSDPTKITIKDYEDFLIHRGKGWVCEINNMIVGFAIVSVTDNNVWALFIDPAFERKGIGKALHDEMISWYFSQTDKTIWLGTAPDTRAEIFYRRAGWKQTGIRTNGEIKFEMTKEIWQSVHPS